MKPGTNLRVAPRRASVRAVGAPQSLLSQLIYREPLNDQLDDHSAASDGVSVGWARHAIAAVILAVLGLVVASSFLLTTTTTDRTGSPINPRLVTQGPDITVAVPEPAAAGTEDRSTGTTGDRGTEADAGTLDIYDRRTQSTSRQSVRDELAKVAAGQKAQQRAEELNRTSADTSAQAAEQAETKRAGDVVGQAKAAAAEQVRLLEVKRKAEEAARLAALKAKEELAKAEAAEKEAGATGAPSADSSTPATNGTTTPPDPSA